VKRRCTVFIEYPFSDFVVLLHGNRRTTTWWSQ